MSFVSACSSAAKEHNMNSDLIQESNNYCKNKETHQLIVFLFIKMPCRENTCAATSPLKPFTELISDASIVFYCTEEERNNFWMFLALAFTD